MGGFQLFPLLFIYDFSNFPALIVIYIIWKFLRTCSSKSYAKSNTQLCKSLFQGHILSLLVPINLWYL